MIRQVAAIFLLFSFALQVFNRSIIVLDYFANTASFAKNCENKARPMLHCNGKCQLMKKIKAVAREGMDSSVELPAAPLQKNNLPDVYPHNGK